MKTQFDVIVIGSGFGGAVSACRLAQRGYRVCILERGQSYTVEPGRLRNYPTSFMDVTRTGVWNEHRCKYGLIEYLSFPKLGIMQGSGVGGGSLHYFGASPRPFRSQFDRLSWPSGINFDAMEPYYITAESMLQVAPIRPTSVCPDLPAKTKAFQSAVQCAGGSSELVPLAINFGQSQNRSVCDHRGDCFIGCTISAKNTLDTNYLKVAVDHGAQIWPLCKVLNIEPVDGQGYRVHFHRFNDNCDDSLVTARVILSAGSTGSTELLLRCKHQYRTLDQISPALGHKFSSNGEYIYAGTLLPRGMPVYPTRGPSITACAKFIEGDEPFLVEDCGITDQMRAMFRKQLFRRKNALQLFERYIQGDLRIELPLKNEIRRTWGRINRLLPYLIMGHDSGNGRIFLNSRGKLCIDWPRDQNYAYYQKARNIVRRISCATGGKFVEDLWSLNDRSFTAHPLGGCVMGDSFDTSVVDASGQVHGYPNLHVVDGSVIPGAIGANPSLTITAIAERINERIT